MTQPNKTQITTRNAKGIHSDHKSNNPLICIKVVQREKAIKFRMGNVHA